MTEAEVRVFSHPSHSSVWRAVPGGEREFVWAMKDLTGVVDNWVGMSQVLWDIESGRKRLFPEATDTEWNDWGWHLRRAVTSLEAVLSYGKFPDSELNTLARVIEKYPVIIPPYYLCLIDFNDPQDPIRLQSFPVKEEIEFADGGEPDPLAEEEDMPVPGLVHRYPDRVLIQVTNLCPMNCRHCTRKREWEEGIWNRTDAEIDRMVDYLARTPQIRDVLLSGGDPFVLSTPKLEKILAKIRSVPHIEILRIGTRFPVVLPQRIDDELVEMLSRYRPLWINTHFNHSREITREAALACEKLQRAGLPMNNQSVLLRGVNDSLPVMKALCHELLKMGVRPYYLYQCDPVKGAEHLRTSIWKGIEIIEGLRGHTTGFAVPQFVIDAPGGGGKIPVGPNYFLGETEDGILLRNYEGLVFEYKNPVPGNPREETSVKDRSFCSSERLVRREKIHANRRVVSFNGNGRKHYHGQKNWA